MRITMIIGLILFASMSSFGSLTKPKQYLPADKASDQPTSAQLYINNGTGSYEYEFQLSENSGFSNPESLKQKRTSGSLVYVRFNKLKFNQTYYWRVKVRSDKDSSSWSNTRSFTTVKSLQLYSPSTNGRTFGGSKAYFSWYRAFPYDSFITQLDTSASFNSTALIQYQTKDTFSTFYGEQVVKDLYYGTKYYFRLKGYGNGDSSQWTNVVWGTVIDTLSNAKLDNWGATTDVDVEVQWSSIGEGFQFQLDTTDSFNSPMLVDSISLNGSENYPQLRFSELLYNQRYYWRLRARNNVDTSSWVSYTFLTYDLRDSRTSFSHPYDPEFRISVPTIDGSHRHIIQLDTTPNFDSHKLIELDSVGRLFTFFDLSFGQNYFVRGKAYHTIDTSNWSRVGTFKVVSNVSQYYPFSSTDPISITDSLTWDASNRGVTHYQIQVSKNKDFSTVWVDSTTPNNGTFGVLNGLTFDFNTRYYWRMRMWHSKDTSDWWYSPAQVRSFITVGAPTLVKPYNSDLIKANAEVDLTWNALKGVPSYQVVLSKDTNFSSDIIVDAFSNSNSIKVSNLLFGQRYYWKVRSCSSVDTSDWTETWSFVVSEKVRLDFPKNNGVNYTFTSLDWSSITGTTGYIIEYDTSQGFVNPTVISDTTKNPFFHYFLTSPKYLYNTKYYWRVKVYHTTDTSQWSDTWSFTTKDRISPVLVYPKNGTTDVPLGITLMWNKYSGANTYVVQYTENSNFDVKQQFIVSSNSRSVVLKPATQYYWRVKSRNSSGNEFGDWSEVWTFTTIDQMETPSLVSPVNLLSDAAIDQTLAWTSIVGASYEVELDDNKDFVSPQKASTNYSFRTYNNLDGRKTYYWRVRAKNVFTVGPWSETWQFTTGRGLSVDSITRLTPMVFPNPVIAHLFINNIDDVEQITLYDLSGKRVLEQTNLRQDNASIDLTSCLPGIYTLVLRARSGNKTYRRVIKL